MHLTGAGVEKCKTAAAMIQSSFVWDCSREGHDFWAEVCKRLQHMDEIYALQQIEKDS